jgi:hypothetical protein
MFGIRKYEYVTYRLKNESGEVIAKFESKDNIDRELIKYLRMNNNRFNLEAFKEYLESKNK